MTSKQPASDTPLARLSPRELEVLSMTAEGLTNEQMAKRLGVTVHAIKFHLAAIYRKLAVANRTEAAVAYLREASMSANGPASDATEALR